MEDISETIHILATSLKTIHAIEGESDHYRKTRELLYAICFSKSIHYINVGFKFKEQV